MPCKILGHNLVPASKGDFLACYFEFIRSTDRRGDFFTRIQLSSLRMKFVQTPAFQFSNFNTPPPVFLPKTISTWQRQLLVTFNKRRAYNLITDTQFVSIYHAFRGLQRRIRQYRLLSSAAPTSGAGGNFTHRASLSVMQVFLQWVDPSRWEGGAEIHEIPRPSNAIKAAHSLTDCPRWHVARCLLQLLR